MSSAFPQSSAPAVAGSSPAAVNPPPLPESGWAQLGIPSHQKSDSDFGSSDVVGRSGSATGLQGALQNLLAIQNQKGGWEGEMVWNSMLLSQHILVRQIIDGGRSLTAETRQQMIQHFRSSRAPDGSGGWGMHRESPAYVYFTTLAYVALRVLGVPPDDPLCADARRFLHSQPGGVLHIPTWGKFWLALCGLYDYAGVNPFPPEVFLLPRQIPFSPWNFYCHTRYVYMGIAYLYGRRFQGDLGPITAALRSELFDQNGQPYSQIDFAAHRHHIAASDLFVAPTAALRATYDLLYQYEKRPLRPLRKLALEQCFDRILSEQRNSRYQGISPVNSLLNCLALFAHSPHHRELEVSLQAQQAWAWYDEREGLRYAGARSQTWDTAFSLQTLVAAQDAQRVHAKADGLSTAETPDLAARANAAHAYLMSLQLTEDLSPHEHAEGARDRLRGGWCFSDGQHRWPVSDCTAEALVAMLQAERQFGRAIHQPLSVERCQQAVEFLLSRQNDDGGFGTYERRRAGGMLEQINPSEMYGSCMTERSYLECTASSLRGLAAARMAHGPQFPAAVQKSMDQAIARGCDRLWQAQRPDGSWPGFWGINFTYAILHVVKAMRALGVSAQDERLQRAALWLLAHQRSDGGWGEHYSSCLTEQYVEHTESQVVMTSWAILALCELYAPGLPEHHAQRAAIARGLAFLQHMQQADGGYPEQAQNGVFFGTAMLDYRLYKSYFPAWALARAASLPATR